MLEESTTDVLELGNSNTKKWARSYDPSWVCEVCKSAPTAFICKTDAASLCVACSAEIHSANPLTCRHHRVPIMRVPGSPYGPSVGNPDEFEPVIRFGHDAHDAFLTHEAIDDDDQDEASSWLFLNPVKNNNTNYKTEYLDLDEYNSGQENHQCTEEYNNQEQQQQQYGNVVVPHKSYGGDSVVPVPSTDAKGQIQQQQYISYEMETVEYETPITGYGYPASLSHSVSMSSMDIGVVPESTMSDVSISHLKGTIKLFSGPPIYMASQLTPMDREARVLRYREKKKTRKFEKTIRYASRKAYAETRPRIKGRFAKKTDAEIKVDQMFSTTLMAEGGHGIVPSF